MNLRDFYRSKDWESFRRLIIQQRTDSSGFVRCAYCGKPIVNKYDLVLHHKTELTEGNVNDAMITLNPDNVECVHFRCHNAIHERFGFGDHPRPRARQVHVVYGPPCSGKTTFVRDNASAGDLVVDLDSLWQAVSIAPRYGKPDQLRAVVFAVRDRLYDACKYREGKWRDAYVITGGAMRGERERLCSRVGATDSILIDTSKEVCLERLSRCADGRDVDAWKGYIERWFAAFQPDSTV